MNNLLVKIHVLQSNAAARGEGMISAIKSWLGNRSQFQWLMFLFLSTFLLCIAGIWYASHRSLQKKLDAIRAQGLPTNMDELNDYYSIPEGVFDSTELWLAAYKALEIADVETKGNDLPFIGEAEEPEFNQEWADYAAAKEFLGNLDGELELIYKAAEAGGQIRIPIVFRSVDVDQTNMVQESRGIARLLSLATHMHVREGNCDTAFRDAKAIFSLANALDGEVTIIAVLIKNAIRAIGTELIEVVLPVCQWSDEELLELQKVVMQINLREGMFRAFNGERVFDLTIIEQFPITILKTANKHFALDCFEKFIRQNTKLSWEEMPDLINQLDMEVVKQASTQLGTMKSFGVLHLFSSLGALVKSTMRAVAKQRCLNAALAAQRYQLKHGNLPATLDSIPHELLTTGKFSEDLLTDPFDGQPLKYQIDSEDKNRLLIYSIGENQIDDGGDCPRDKESRPLDVGFWLKVTE